MSAQQKFFTIIILVAVVIIGAGAYSFAKKQGTLNINDGYGDGTQTQETMNEGTFDNAALADQVTQVATLKTNEGDIVIELYGGLVPKTVENFVTLAREGFYNDVRFHRVIDGFMIQAGDPNTIGGANKDVPMGQAGSWGSGGPGYQFEDEFVPELTHASAGILSMANAGPNTNGSQFFITLAPTPHLNNVHSVFGYVIDGMDVVRTIGRTPTEGPDRPIDDIIINSIEIQDK